MSGEGIDVEAIRARADKATPGPWRARLVDDGEFYGSGASFDIERTRDDGTQEIFIFGGPAEPGGPHLGACEAGDAEFITAARLDVPALLDALDAARAENQRLRDALSTIRDWATTVHGGTVAPIDVWPGLRASLSVAARDDTGTRQ